MKKILIKFVNLIIFLPTLLVLGIILKIVKKYKTPRIIKKSRTYREKITKIPNDFQSQGSSKFVIKLAEIIFKFSPVKSNYVHEDTNTNKLYTMW